jgi:hypothetical protein
MIPLDGVDILVLVHSEQNILELALLRFQMISLDHRIEQVLDAAAHQTACCKENFGMYTRQSTAVMVVVDTPLLDLT